MVRLTQRTILLAMRAIGSLAASAIALYFLLDIGDTTIASIIAINAITGGGCFTPTGTAGSRRATSAQRDASSLVSQASR